MLQRPDKLFVSRVRVFVFLEAEPQHACAERWRAGCSLEKKQGE
jgi:hypothetical protein